MSNSLWPHGLQHARLPCPSLSPKVCSNSYPLVRWCHPTISFSVAPFSCPQSFPASESFPVSQLLTSILKYWSFIFSISPSSEYSGLISFRNDWFDSLLSKGLLRVFFSIEIQKHQFFGTRSNIHIHTWLQEKPSLWVYGPLLAKWGLCFLICCLGLS